MEQIDRFQRGEDGAGDWKRLAKEHICIYAKPMDIDNTVVKLGGGGAGQGLGGGRKKVGNGRHL